MTSQLIYPLSRLKGFIAVFYDVKKSNIIWVGSSQIGSHQILANTHVEEIAITKIKKYISKNRFRLDYKKHIKIIIFKKYQLNNQDLIKEVFCCRWCLGIFKKYNILEDNVLTISGEKLISSIHSDTYYIKKPLKKCQIVKA